MRRPGRTFPLFLCVLFSWRSAPTAEAISGADSYTLGACYEMALSASEELQIEREKIKETETRIRQARGRVLPSASFESSDKRQDSASPQNQFTLDYIPERKFSATQPLFSGFKDFTALAAAKAQKRSQSLAHLRREQTLLLEVAQAFYSLLESQDDLRVLRDMERVFAERVTELAGRERLGRSRAAETSQARSRLARTQAERRLAEGRAEAAREAIAYFTGRPIPAVTEPGLVPDSLPSEDDFLKRAARRPDLLAASEDVGVSASRLAYARGGYWPSADVEGNYYAQRAGILKGVDWDVIFRLEVPLFSGGRTKAEVDEARSRFRQAGWARAGLERQAATEVRVAYAELQAAVERLPALEQALRESEENYRLQSEDYRLRLVNTLEVLEALENLQDVRREIVKARVEAQWAYLRLRVAAGEGL